MSRATQRPEIRCPDGLSGGPLPPEVWTDCSFITLAFSDTALTDPRNRAEGAGGPDVGQTIEDLLLQKAAWEAKGREAVLVRIDDLCIRQPVEPGRDSAFGPDTPPVEPAAVLVLKRYVQEVTGDPEAHVKLYDEVRNACWELKQKARSVQPGKLVNNSNIRFRAVFVPGVRHIPTHQQTYDGGADANLKNDENAFPLLKAIRASQDEELPHCPPTAVTGANAYPMDHQGILMHGDAERNVIRNVRLGEGSMRRPLRFAMYHRNVAIGRCEVPQAAGDMLIMSKKAMGCDWRSPSLVTFRHAVGPPNVTAVVSRAERERRQQRKQDRKRKCEECVSV